MILDRIPDISNMVPRRARVDSTDEAGRVTVLRRRPGVLRPRLLRIFGIPPIVKVHLDPVGSEVWRLIDGTRRVADIKHALEEKFPEETNLAPRLGHFFSIMVSRELVELVGEPAA